MSFFGDLRHTPAATKPPGAAAGHGGADPSVPLMNLSLVQARMDNLHQFLSDSVNGNILLGQSKMDMVSSEIAFAIEQIIVNGSALLSCPPPVCSNSAEINTEEKGKVPGLLSCPPSVCSNSAEKNREEKGKGPVNPVDPKVEIEDFEIIEMDAVELLAEHVHFCEICGKGFKRDANLRMHMRAHGNRFKTVEALARPENGRGLTGRRTRFSCPFLGCNRNRQHGKFRPLKSVICVKNHFKRSHCPRLYCCDRCNKKSFSVVADLKSHLKHCGERKWKCSCGTSFSRKDKLFGHMALFEGHMPAVVEEGKAGAAAAAAAVEGEEVSVEGGLESDKAFLEGFLDEFESIENYCVGDELYVNNGMEGWFNF